jgi:hypothetical protein
VTHATEESLPCRLEIIGSKGRAWIIENEMFAENNAGLLATVELCPDPFLETWREFVRFVRGEKPHTGTQLQNTRGYVLATNAALLSSGDIWEIRDSAGLAGLIETAGQEGKLFSELGVPWAIRAGPVEVSKILRVDLYRA